jgi:hypothetical protein
VPDPSIAKQVYNKQNGVCTIPQWRTGLCKSTPDVFDIPFAELSSTTATFSSTRTEA